MGVTGQRRSLGAIDRSFLAQERRDVMMHVGALLEFSPSKESSADFARDFSRDLREELKVRYTDMTSRRIAMERLMETDIVERLAAHDDEAVRALIRDSLDVGQAVGA